MWSAAARLTCACLCLTFVWTIARAQPEPSGGGTAISLTEALTRTLARNPALAAFGYEIEAAEGRLRQAELRPNPELGITVEDFLGDDTHSGLGSAETTVSLGFVLERGARERLIDAARAGIAVRGADADLVRLDAAAETARRFLACLAYQARLRNAGLAVEAAEQTVRSIAERVAAGRALAAELARAEVDLAWAELIQEDYEHELLSAYHRLSAQWGETEPDFAAAMGDVTALPPAEPFEALLARVDENPELARFMSQQRLDEAELRLAEARRRPSWQVSAGLRRYERSDDFGLVGNLTVPLPVSDRNQGRIAEARSGVARTRAEMTASRVRTETTLFVLHQQLNHHLQVAARLTAEVMPKLERALADTRRAYELGRYGYSEWRVVQRELLEANDALLDAAIEAHGIVIEIERLTGVRFASPTAQ